RTIDHVGAEGADARVGAAEIGIEQPASERGEHVADGDLLGRAREGIAARLAARRLDETALPQHAHHFGDVRLGDTFRARQLADRHAALGSLAPDSDEAAQTVFFLRGEFHRSILRLTAFPAAVSPRPTSFPGSRADQRAPARRLPRRRAPTRS